MVQKRGFVASRREEQRKRDQSLALSFSVSVSRKDFMVRMVGSLCSFIKCRTLVCIIYEKEGLSLLFFSSFEFSVVCLSNLRLCL